jgi:FKBP-type peptidyl-prolyl cis-trans isomerase SlpA
VRAGDVPVLQRGILSVALAAGWPAVTYNTVLPAFIETMPDTQAPVVTPSAYLTLHYRLATEGGEDIVTTFNGNPATLMLGQDQLAPFLEERLLGMEEGAHQTFHLAPAEAFGERTAELIQPVTRATLEENSVPGADYQVGELVDFAAPNGGRFAGVLRELGDEVCIFDFNHPLAGQALQFEVKLISVL